MAVVGAIDWIIFFGYLAVVRLHGQPVTFSHLPSP